MDRSRNRSGASAATRAPAAASSSLALPGSPLRPAASSGGAPAGPGSGSRVGSVCSPVVIVASAPRSSARSSAWRNAGSLTAARWRPEPDEHQQRRRALDPGRGVHRPRAGERRHPARRQLRLPGLEPPGLAVGRVEPVEVQPVEVRAAGEVVVERAQHQVAGHRVEAVDGERPRADRPRQGRHLTAPGDRGLRQREQRRDVDPGRAQRQIDAVAGRAHGGDRREQPADAAAHPLERVHHVGRGHHRLVVKRHAAAQRDVRRGARRVEHRRPDREVGLDRTIRADRVQRVEHQPDHRDLGVRLRGDRIRTSPARRAASP